MNKTSFYSLTTQGRHESSAVTVRQAGCCPYVRLDTKEPTSITALDRSVLLCGCASEAMDILPERSIQTVVTSPPYWSLRDYEVDRQIGRDDPLNDYLASIVETFDKLRRVLTDDGTVWLNVGDAYTSGNRRYRAPDRKNRARAMSVRPVTPEGLKPKDLIGIPGASLSLFRMRVGGFGRKSSGTSRTRIRSRFGIDRRKRMRPYFCSPRVRTTTMTSIAFADRKAAG